MTKRPSDLEMELMAAAVPRELAPAGVNVVLLGDALQIARRKKESATPPDEIVNEWMARAQIRYAHSALRQFRYVSMKYAEWVKQNEASVAPEQF